MMLEDDNEAEGEQNKRNKSNQSLSLAVVGSSKFKSKSGLSMTHPLPPSASNLTRSSLHHSHALGFLHVFTSLAHVNVSWVLHPSLCINIYIIQFLHQLSLDTLYHQIWIRAFSPNTNRHLIIIISTKFISIYHVIRAIWFSD